MPATLERKHSASRAIGSSAMVWIDERRAMVARTRPRGGQELVEIDRRLDGEAVFLARVVHAIGDRERVMIMGPGTARLALEREYVAIYQRPDRLVDVEPSGPVSARELVERLRILAR